MVEEGASAEAGPERLGTDRDGIARAAGLMRAGHLIAYPTETQYGLGADALNESALDRAALAKGRGEGPFLVVVADAEAAAGLTDEMPSAALRIAETCWPGPVTILLPARDGLPGRIVGEGGTVAVRVSGSETACSLAGLLGGPLLSTSANPTGSAPIIDAEAIGRIFGEHLSAVVDGGPLRPGPPSTIVDGRRTPVRIFREGTVSPNSLARRTGLEVEGGRAVPLVLLVCTGNACRSPMAEGVLRHLLREKGLDGEVEVASAGTAAVHWGAATAEAQAATWEEGIDISAHRPRQLDAVMVREADLLVAMSEEHGNRIALLDPTARARTHLLVGLAKELSGRPPRGSREVADPIGRPSRFYRKVLDGMEKELGSAAEQIAEVARANREAR